MIRVSDYSVGIFDIDGCIIDSRNECFSVLSRLYKDKYDLSIEELQNVFFEYRFLVRTADQFKSLISTLIEDKNNIVSRFRQFEKNYSKYKRDEFLNNFFSTRNIIIAENEVGWLNLHEVYSPFRNIRNFSNLIDNVYVVSAKNTSAIKKILKFFDFNLDKCEIFGGENKDKDYYFRKIRSYHLEEKIFLIDDNTENLFNALQFEIDGYLAGWGYVDPKIEVSSTSLVYLDEKSGIFGK